MRRTATMLCLAAGIQVGLAARVASPQYKEVCTSAAKALCVTYPAAWKRESVRIESEKITAIYAYHKLDAATGVAEGLDATLSPAGSSFDAKVALSNDIQARKEISSVVTYSASGLNWYVISGTDFRGNIFYSKIVKHGNSYKTLNILYPPQNKTYWKAVLGNITRNFK